MSRQASVFGGADCGIRTNGGRAGIAIGAPISGADGAIGMIAGHEVRWFIELDPENETVG
jgi:hypothetical protein